MSDRARGVSAGMRGVGSARWFGIALLVSIGALPFLPLLTALFPGLASVERVLYAWFDLHCARDPARTPHALGVPLALCARCSGIYFGLGSGALLRRPRLTPKAMRLWVTCAAAFMIADVALEHLGLHPPWAGLRVVTGMLLAYPVGVGLGQAMRSPSRPAPTHNP